LIYERNDGLKKWGYGSWKTSGRRTVFTWKKWGRKRAVLALTMETQQSII
jgi:hypothetical protein